MIKFELQGVIEEVSYSDPEDSEKLADVYFEKAKKTLEEDEHHGAVMIVFGKHRKAILDANPGMRSPEIKTAFFGAIRQMCKEMDAVACVFISEVWMLKAKSPEEYEKARKKRGTISDHPDTIEAIMVNAQYKGQREVMRSAQIFRRSDGSVLKLSEMLMDNYDKMGGQASGLLEPLKEVGFYDLP
jgi:hypothetical protein